GRDDRVTVGDSASVLLRSRAALVCSGTATLEAAICNCPMTVIYAIPPSAKIEIKLLRMKRPKFVALPNILLDREIVGEFVADEAVPERVRPYLESLLTETPALQTQLEGFEALALQLGPDDAITQTALLALAQLGIATKDPARA